jgi:protein-disulfide isomerase
MNMNIAAGHISRRLVLGACLALGLAAPVLAQGTDDAVLKSLLPDSYIGADNAPVSLIVYSSPTCSHCVDFHANELPKLQEKFVSTGKLKIAYRPFMRNSLDAVIFMLAHSRGADKFDETVSTYMDKFDELSAAQDTEQAVRSIAEGMGIDKAGFDKAVADQPYFDQLNAATKQAQEEFKVAGTPTFFLDGKQLEIASSFEEVGTAVEAALPKP